MIVSGAKYLVSTTPPSMPTHEFTAIVALLQSIDRRSASQRMGERGNRTSHARSKSVLHSKNGPGRSQRVGEHSLLNQNC